MKIKIKMRKIILSMLAAMIVLTGMVSSVGTVSASIRDKDHEEYPINDVYYFWKVIRFGSTVEIPKQDVPEDTWLFIDYTDFGKPINGVWPIGPIYHFSLLTVKQLGNEKEVLLNPIATICMPVTDEMLSSTDGDPKLVGIAKAEVFGEPYVLLKTIYYKQTNMVCANPIDINGSFTAIYKRQAIN